MRNRSLSCALNDVIYFVAIIFSIKPMNFKKKVQNNALVRTKVDDVIFQLFNQYTTYLPGIFSNYCCFHQLTYVVVELSFTLFMILTLILFHSGLLLAGKWKLSWNYFRNLDVDDANHSNTKPLENRWVLKCVWFFFLNWFR